MTEIIFLFAGISIGVMVESYFARKECDKRVMWITKCYMRRDMDDYRERLTRNAEEFDSIVMEILDRNLQLTVALKELCKLKKMKDKLGKTEYYQTCKPIAWERAFKLIGEDDDKQRNQSTDSKDKKYYT